MKKRILSLSSSILMVTFIMILLACNKKDVVPALMTNDVSSLTPTSCTVAVTIKSEGGSQITSCGVCWSTSSIPTLSDFTASGELDSTNFTITIIGLVPGTTYSVRAFATNSTGTGYGNVATFTTQIYGTVTDVEGNSYKTVNIGTQVWMAENLKTTEYRNGDLIETTTPITLDISDQNEPKYQWDNYNGSETNVLTYGRLYTWYTVSDYRGICPAGWHVPTEKDLESLVTFLGGNMVAGGKLKENGTAHWYSPNTGATNETGFSALPGTDRTFFGGFSLNGFECTYWTVTDLNIVQALYWYLSCNDNHVSSGYDGKKNGFSIRCVKDN
jgi:uncharacterized protein (TIGR02145 family)